MSGVLNVQEVLVKEDLCTDLLRNSALQPGLFLGPQMVGEALKGGRLLAQVFANRGYQVHPSPDPSETQTPIPSFITAIQLGSPELMQAFCRAVQRNSPVGAYVMPVPGMSHLNTALPFVSVM